MDTILQRWLNHLRVEKGSSPHTFRAYGRDLNSLATHLSESEKTLASATLTDLRSWLSRTAPRPRDGGRTNPASMSRRVASVRSFYRWLLKEGIIDQSPAERLQAPKVPRHSPRFLDVDEMSMVVENPTQKGWFRIRNRALLEITYGAGLRVSEVVGLDTTDLQLEDRLVRVVGKGKKERIVPFGPPAEQAIRELMRHSPGAGPLFRNRTGGRLSARSAWRIVRDAGITNGVVKLHPHSLRHTCATHLLSGGADLRAIQEQLGHASLSTTQRYTHVDAAHLLSVYRSAHPHAKLDPDDPDGA